MQRQIQVWAVRTAAAAVVTVAMCLAGCERGSDNRNITGGRQVQSEAERRAAWAVEERDGRVINVEVSGERINMPSSVEAGPVVFKVKNTGQAAHGFRIEGQGLDRPLSSTLQPGESGTVAAELKPGTYRIHHPSPAHGDGAPFELTVTQRQGGQRAATQPAR